MEVGQKLKIELIGKSGSTDLSGPVDLGLRVTGCQAPGVGHFSGIRSFKFGSGTRKLSCPVLLTSTLPSDLSSPRSYHQQAPRALSAALERKIKNVAFEFK